MIRGAETLGIAFRGRLGHQRHAPTICWHLGRNKIVQINVTTRHGHINENTQERITTKAEKLLRFFERLTSIEVVIDLKDAHQPRVDVKVSAEHKHDFLSHDQADKVITAAESAIHKMEQQLRRYKEKVQERGRDPNARRVEVTDNDPGDTPDEMSEE